jgi:hypothetical protein
MLGTLQRIPDNLAISPILDINVERDRQSENRFVFDPNGEVNHEDFAMLLELAASALHGELGDREVKVSAEEASAKMAERAAELFEQAGRAGPEGVKFDIAFETGMRDVPLSQQFDHGRFRDSRIRANAEGLRVLDLDLQLSQARKQDSGLEQRLGNLGLDRYINGVFCDVELGLVGDPAYYYRFPVMDPMQATLPWFTRDYFDAGVRAGGLESIPTIVQGVSLPEIGEFALTLSAANMRGTLGNVTPHRFVARDGEIRGVATLDHLNERTLSVTDLVVEEIEGLRSLGMTAPDDLEITITIEQEKRDRQLAEFRAEHERKGSQILRLTDGANRLRTHIVIGNPVLRLMVARGEALPNNYSEGVSAMYGMTNDFAQAVEG